MNIEIIQELLAPVRSDGMLDFIDQRYADNSAVHRIERHTIANEGDFYCGSRERESFDNGRSWGDWHDAYKENFARMKGGERLWEYGARNVYHPVNRHYLTLKMERLFVDNHQSAYDRFWKECAADSFYDHSFLAIRDEETNVEAMQLLRYESGPESGDLTEADYIRNNYSYSLGDIVIAANGDILIAMSIPVAKCCQMAGLNSDTFFPSCPEQVFGMIIARGHWEPETRRYRFRFSKPVVISDLQSSRGIDEPTLAELPNGRIVVVFRGSNLHFPPWRTRIEPGTPGFKWYTWSDDGGQTFTAPQPWHFDSGEVVYSSASISKIFKSEKNHRHYWIGNITDPTVTHGNFPRYPLHIVELDSRFGTAKAETLQIIDTRRQGESKFLELSNFTLLQDRQSGVVEVYLAKCGMHSPDGRQDVHKGESWRYLLTLPPDEA